MERTRPLLLAFIGAVVISACNTPPTRQDVGTVVGGVIGGVVGSELTGDAAGTILGTLVGSFVGSAIGGEMDRNDRRHAAHTLETAPTGSTTQWVNPDTGVRYRVTPKRTFELGGGPCREYTVEAQVGGKPETVTGTACRQADGSWLQQH